MSEIKLLGKAKRDRTVWVAPFHVRPQALAALQESDPPDRNCPVGARVRVCFGEEEDAEWFEGYLVERRASDGKFLCIFDEDDGEEYWYATGEPDFEILGL